MTPPQGPSGANDPTDLDGDGASSYGATRQSKIRGLPTAADPSRSEVQADGSTSGLSVVERDRYQARALLGLGGMGEVELHLDRRIGRQVARKTIRPSRDTPESRLRFLREARVQGQLEHPAIVPVYDLGTMDGGHPYFTMKRVHGLTLASILQGLVAGDPQLVARFTRRKLLMAFVQVCLAVEYAHARGVFHRDLKPTNIMLGDLGEVYVLDWGIAKLASDSERPPGSEGVVIDGSGVATAHSTFLGTPIYMAPEQLMSTRPFDARADVFALGAILFEIITRQPLRRSDSEESVLAQARREPPRPSSRAVDIPPELDAVCARALAPVPEDRTGSALEVAEAVERYLEGDRDLAARRALAREHLSRARTNLTGDDVTPDARVFAIREAMRALALEPDAVEVQELLLSLIVDGSGALPASAERELGTSLIDARRELGRIGMLVYGSWVLCFPFAVLLGIRDWTAPALGFGAALLCLLLAVLVARDRRGSTALGLSLATLTAFIVAVMSCWLGPFVLSPVTAAASGVLFMSHATKREGRPLLLMWAVAIVAPFVVEYLHIFPRAYTFTAAGVLLHPRAFDLREGPTVLALIYTSVSFACLTMLIVGRMKDRERDAERRLFVQAWYLRQLFPAGAGAEAAGRERGASK